MLLAKVFKVFWGFSPVMCYPSIHPLTWGAFPEGLGRQHGFKRVGFVQQRGEAFDPQNRKSPACMGWVGLRPCIYPPAKVPNGMGEYVSSQDGSSMTTLESSNFQRVQSFF